ncbi:hypothetical protein [Sphingobacterium hungaricum]
MKALLSMVSFLALGNNVNASNYDSNSSSNVGFFDIIEGVDITNLSIFSYIILAFAIGCLIIGLIGDKRFFEYIIYCFMAFAVIEYNHTKNVLTDERTEQRKKFEEDKQENNRIQYELKRCDFDKAYQIGRDFLVKENLVFVKDGEGLSKNSIEPCSITYNFSVKILNFDEWTRSESLSERIYRVRIQLTKYGDVYNIETADLFDDVKGVQRDLIGTFK